MSALVNSGFAPKVTLTNIEGGVQITVENARGETDSVNLYNGGGGGDGVYVLGEGETLEDVPGNVNVVIDLDGENSSETDLQDVLRFTKQELTEEQKVQARENIGVGSTDSLPEDINLEGVVRYNQAQTLTDDQQAQARTNIAALGQSDLEDATNTALEKAKASGEFDGEDGVDGKDGANGKDGKDGVSVTHSWSGTTLTIVSASGKSSANLKGDKGDKGETGAQGAQGEKGDKGDTGASGADGRTPVKGTDYFTESDKTELVNAVLAMIPIYDGEVIAE
jgi:hypothetical protein